jgi:hypothetical protein
MTRRERVFLVLAVALGLVAVVYNFGLKSSIGALADERDQLELERITYDDYIDELRDEPRVQEQWRKILEKYPIELTEPGQLTAMIEKELKTIGMAGTNIGASQEEIIEDAEDYGYLTLEITCTGDVTKVARMLNFYDAQAILVKEIKLTARVDSPIITVKVTVSRLVKWSEEKKAELKKKADERRGPLPRGRRRMSPGGL